MYLGVYWYFGFPEGLYNFDYFKFIKGNGGHADNPVELIANIKTSDSDSLIEKLKLLVNRYDEGLLFIYRENNNLEISTGGYQLFDYDFLFIKEVESLLKNENVQLTDEKFQKNQLIKLSSGKDIDSASTGFLQIVGSSLRKSNAETMSLRLDCHLNIENKKSFIDKLTLLVKSSDINIFYYYDCDFSDNTNLMLFFTNGRQGINLQKKQDVNIPDIENKLKTLFEKYNVSLRHKGGMDFYPKNGPNVKLIVDKEYVL